MGQVKVSSTIGSFVLLTFIELVRLGLKTAYVYYIAHLHSSNAVAFSSIINPRRACAERVTVVVSCVCVSVRTRYSGSTRN